MAAISSVPLARHLVRDDLERRGVRPAGVDNSVLIVTELVTNSILHARPLNLEGDRFGVVLTWSVDDECVVVEVTDGGGIELPQLRRPLPVDTAGRGLAIVDAIAREWLISSEDSQVTVRAVIAR
ncbi:MAG: ATP-binding protein [Jiangellaceae bacterium]